jgi:ribokinase
MADLLATGGIILDNVVTADGAVHLDGLGGNAVYSAAGARLWSRRVACVGLVPRNYPAAALAPLAAAGIDLSGVRRVEAEVAAPEWFFHRPDGSRVDGLHAPRAGAAGLWLARARIDPADARRFEAHLRAGGGSSDGFRCLPRPRIPSSPRTCRRPSGPRRAACTAPQTASTRSTASSFAARGRARRVARPRTPGPRHVPADLDAFLDECDIFLPSEAEIRILVPGEEPMPALRELARRGTGRDRRQARRRGLRRDRARRRARRDPAPSRRRP